jgi:3-oxoacyl-[acyl-carrier protein] reductase
MRLAGKVAWITGGGNGIGRATAKLFAQQGAKILISDIDQEAVQAVSNEISESGGESTWVTGSVSDKREVDEMVKAGLEAFDRLDILINNAGVTRDALTVKIKEDDIKMMAEEAWEAVLDVNLKGSFLCSQAAAVPMIRQNSGRIVNTSSVAALGNIGQANYAASKAGVIGLTRTLALEWARFNITVNCLAPGGTRTRMIEGIPEKVVEKLQARIPLGRFAEPEEIAAAHLFLASDDASYITGQVLFVDGGISVGA